MKHFKITLSAVLLLCAVKAYANISVYPYAVEFDANKGKRVIPIRVSNPTPVAKTYKISIMDVKQRADGGYDEIPAGEERPATSAAPYVTFSPRQFTVDARDFQTVNVGRKPLLKAPEGDYVSRIKIEEVDTPAPRKPDEEQKNVSVEINLQYAITIPIYIKKGKAEGSAKITAARVEYFKDGKPYLFVNMEREGGPKYLRGAMTAAIDKKPLGELKNVRLYPENPAREVRIPIEGKFTAAKDLTGKKIKIVYKNDGEKANISEAEFVLAEKDIIPISAEAAAAIKKAEDKAKKKDNKKEEKPSVTADETE